MPGPREGPIAGKTSPALAATAPDRDSAAVAFTSFRIRNWTVEDGLLGRAADVAQTPDGYLWVATSEGLFRFDGARFVGFTTANVPAFRSNDFNRVDVLPSGDLWVGSRDRWTYRLRGGTWAAYSVDEALGGDWVQGFVEDGEGTVWVANSDRRVARFDGTGWAPLEQRIRTSWAPFIADAAGTLWTYLDAADAPGFPTSPLHRYGGVVARWDGERFTPPQDWRLFGFEQTQHGPLFHRPAGAGPAPTSPAAMRGLRVHLADADGTPRGDYAVEDVPRSAHLVDRAGRVWTEPIVSDGSVTVLDGDVAVAVLRPEGARWLESLYEDRQGNVWVLTSAGSLLQVTPEPFRRFGPEDGAPGDAESAFATADGEILVSARGATEDAPVLAVRDGSWTSRMIPPGAALPDDDPTRNPTVGMITEDGRGRRFGTYGSQLVRLHGDRVEPVWQNTSGPRVRLRIPFPDPADPDALWIEVGPGVLGRFDTAALVVTDSLRVPLPTSGLAWTTDVHRTANGRLWVASRGGLVVVEDGRPRTVEALAGVPVRDLATGPDGSLWAATETRGLVRIRDGEVSTVGVDEGLATTFLMAVLFDDSGFVWLSGPDLLYRIRTADIERAFDDAAFDPIDVVTLPPSAGHLGMAAGHMRAARAPDGSLWIPSRRGITRIDPTAYARQFAAPPPAIVEAVRTQSGAWRLAEGEANLRLPRGDRSPMVDYTAIDLTAPDLVRFRTQLVGLDNGWRDQGAERSAVYGGLAPGTYTFRVQARNGGGVWSDPVEATFVVPTFFYETGWFLVLCGLGLLAALVLGVRARERTQRARRRELESLVEERTEQLQAEKEVVAAQARDLETLYTAKSAFFANVSHEFRTPLTLTIGPLDDVRTGLYGELSPDLDEQLALAQRNAGRVLALINQILDVARLEAGRMQLRARRLDLGAFLRGVAQGFAPLVERKGISLDVRVPEDGAEVWADPEHLQKVFANLLSNALKYTPAGGAVLVTVRAEADVVHTVVRDSGPGIAEAHLPHVFERFYRVDESAARRQPGTGIGLALVKELVDLHGGTITVESEEGFGSRFTITLRRGRGHLRPEDIVEDEPLEGHLTFDGLLDGLPAAVAPAAAGNGALDRIGSDDEDDGADDVTTVLVVEDNAELRAYVRRHLEPAYRVVEAADGADGLAKARDLLPDLVLSDVMMPEMDGFALLAALRADPETDFLPVVLLTARAEAEDRLGGLGLGADDYLTKPFDVRELRARVDNLIAGRQRLRERFAAADPTAASVGNGSIHPAPVDVDSDDAVFLDRVRAAIEAHLGDETFTVERLAEAVGVSRGHLHRKLKALAGRTPSEAIQSFRIERGAQLLAAGAGTVSEVAYAVGFKSVSHFSGRFEKAYGHRPSRHPAAA